jgi:hypothetical protein
MLFDGPWARRRDRRNLASAFIGEIAAAMESVEEHIGRRLEGAASREAEPPFDFGDFQLPRLAVYEANVGRLTLFNAPLPRELSYFYTRLAALPARLRALKPSSSSSAEVVKQNSQRALEEVTRTMQLGENILHNIKGFVSRKQPDSISRA